MSRDPSPHAGPALADNQGQPGAVPRPGQPAGGRGAAREPDEDEPRGHPAEVGQLPAGEGGGAQQDQQLHLGHQEQRGLHPPPPPDRLPRQRGEQGGPDGVRPDIPGGADAAAGGQAGLSEFHQRRGRDGGRVQAQPRLRGQPLQQPPQPGQAGHRLGGPGEPGGDSRGEK